MTVRVEFHPHNALLQTLVAWGFVGLACVLIIVLRFATTAVMAARSYGNAWLPPLMGSLVLVVYSAHDGTLFFPFPLSMVATFAGLLAAPKRQA